MSQKKKKQKKKQKKNKIKTKRKKEKKGKWTKKLRPGGRVGSKDQITYIVAPVQLLHSEPCQT
jgi:hypothetical protein